MQWTKTKPGREPTGFDRSGHAIALDVASAFIGDNRTPDGGEIRIGTARERLRTYRRSISLRSARRAVRSRVPDFKSPMIGLAAAVLALAVILVAPLPILAQPAGNDAASTGTLSFRQTAITVSEPETDHVLLVVQRTGPTTTAVTFHLKAADGTATGGYYFFDLGDDYITLFDDPYSIAAGETSTEGIFLIFDDDVDEDDETFTVSIAVDPDSGYRVVGGPATVTITDDDTAGVTVTAANPLRVDEGGTNAYTVVLDSEPTHDVTITATSGDGGAATVSPASHTFTSADWYSARTFTVSGVSDTDSQDERVGISHRASSQDGKYGGLSVASVSVSVSDNTPSQGRQRHPNQARQPQPEDSEQSEEKRVQDEPGEGQPGPENLKRPEKKQVQDEPGQGLSGPENREQPEEQAPARQQARDSSLELTGTDGPDDLEGGDGDDVLVGKKGKDVLRGYGGNDELRGGRGADDLHGGRGADNLEGGNGSDQLSGGRGADRLLGGGGDDTLTGGPGKDRFIFFSGETGDNVITDFGDGDDLIVLKTEGAGAPWPPVSDIIAGVVAQGDRYLVYTLSTGLTVETDTPLRTEDFLVK